MDIMFAEQ